MSEERNQYEQNDYPLRRGDAGTMDVVGHMVKFVDDGRARRDVIALACDILRGIDWRDEMAIVAACQKWVQNNIEYRLDPDGIEFVRAAEVTLDHRAGDCDCQSVLLASLISSVASSIPLAFALCRQGGRGTPFSHVLVAAYINDVWVPLETIEPFDAGVWPPQVVSVLYQPIVFNGEHLAGFFDKVVKEFKRGGRRIEKQVKRSAKDVEHFAKKLGRGIGDVVEAGLSVKDINSLEDLVKISHGRIRVNTRIIAGLVAGPVGFALGSKKNITRLNKLGESIPVIGMPIFPTTIDDYLKQWSVTTKIAAAIPGPQQAAAAALSAGVTYAQGVRSGGELIPHNTGDWLRLGSAAIKALPVAGSALGVSSGVTDVLTEVGSAAIGVGGAVYATQKYKDAMRELQARIDAQLKASAGEGEQAVNIRSNLVGSRGEVSAIVPVAIVGAIVAALLMAGVV